VIGLLRGQVLETTSEGTLLVEVGGVGYEVQAPLGTAGRLRSDGDGSVTLFVHTHVREDALILFGFSSRAERTAFRTLISVAKVGPKLALAVLGSLQVEQLARVVAAGAVVELSKIPGIGKKTAERIVLELEGKLTPPPPDVEPAAAGKMATAAGGQAALVQEALVRMGFRPAEAERAVGSLPDHDRPLGELVREALSILAP
jgi:Holliday junction DNA helicase RuvA